MPLHQLYTAIASRHSLGAKHQTAPAPSRAVLEKAVACARRVPCHEKVLPVRYVLIESRDKLADLYQSTLGPDADEAMIRRARDKATKSPGIVAVIETNRTPDMTPLMERERMMSLGAGFQNFLLALTAEGFVGKVVTGREFPDPMGLFDPETERLHAFIMVGTPDEPIAEENVPAAEEPMLTTW